MSYSFSFSFTPSSPISLDVDSQGLLAELLAKDIKLRNHFRVSTSGVVYCYTQNRWAVCFQKESEFESGLYTAILTAANSRAIIVQRVIQTKAGPATAIVAPHLWIRFVSSTVAKYLLKERDTEDSVNGLIEQQLLSSPWVGFECGMDLRWDPILRDYEIEPACPDHYVVFRHKFDCPTIPQINNFENYLPTLYGAQIERLFGRDPRNANLASAYLGAVACSAHTQKMLNIEGASGIGKSVFLEIAEAMIPEKYRASIPLGQEKSSNFDFESVTRAKLITVHEAGKEKISNSETVKALITGNTTSIDRKGKSRLDIKCKANMIVISNDPLALDNKSDPKSTAARMLIIKAEGKSIRDTEMEIERYGQVIWDEEGPFLMIYLLGMWRYAACGKAAMWREWSEPAREAALETAYEAMPDLRFIKDYCEITNDKSDTISLLEFADMYKSFRNDQGRSNFEYGKDHAKATWKKFDAKRLFKTTVTYKTQRYPSHYVVVGVRWNTDNFPVSDIQDLLVTVN